MGSMDTTWDQHQTHTEDTAYGLSDQDANELVTKLNGTLHHTINHYQMQQISCTYR